MNFLQTVMAHNLTGKAGRKPIVLEGAEQVLTPAAGKVYRCGTLSSLTVINPPTAGLYCICFSSGALPTTTVFPAAVIGLESFAAKAFQHYEIVVLDGYASVNQWAVEQ